MIINVLKRKSLFNEKFMLDFFQKKFGMNEISTYSFPKYYSF